MLLEKVPINLVGVFVPCQGLTPPALPLSINGVVKARECKHCGYQEIGIVTKNGKFIALKAGDKVMLVEN
jgi:hypothetical protein